MYILHCSSCIHQLDFCLPFIMSAAAGSTAAVAAASSPTEAAVAVAAKPKFDLGLIRKAMAFRVKYRLVGENGSLKRRLPLRIMGVHPENRGGVYPQAGAVRQLGIELVKAGFNQEEADHQGVCVEDIPAKELSEVADSSAVAESYQEYNRRRCAGSSYLEKCFVESNVLYGTLSHSHLLLVCLSWLGGAQWELQGADKALFTLDATDRLNLQAAVAVENLQELCRTCQEGFLMEVLSWKINTEEPTACSLISKALNTANEVALKTTELTAVAVLSGECGLQWQRSSSDEISFQEVKAAVRQQLDTLAEEAEFQELFDFVINLGASRNPYVPDLIDFGARFINPKQRQLRLGAFTTVNKMNNQCPRSKIAALKRAYRKNPTYGYCPSPDARFHSCEMSSVSQLEQLLHYFHIVRKTAVAALGSEHQQSAFLANVDVAAADSFISCKPDATLQALQKHLLRATYTYYKQLQDTLTQEPDLDVVAPRLKWIVFTPEESTKPSSSAVAADKKRLCQKLSSLMWPLVQPSELKIW